MPHMRIEYSGNLHGRVDIAAFCKRVHAAILATGLFEVGAVRTRAFCADHFEIADGIDRNAFIDLHLRIAEGRPPDKVKAAGEAIFSVASESLQEILVEPYFALSFSIDEINSALSWKKNSMHSRLR